ncbi:MAG: hypothetical protein CFE31_17545 [Rhizobiales bacterium PAR1]|nr:MAG: hypothetical protein CFE31_17545 [Rhizobiales bacterium PAR1]
MGDDHQTKPRKRVDETRFRQELFRKAAVKGELQPERAHADEHSESARPNIRSDLFARPSTGYGNPPVETRFAKGQSGNPKGRPRGSGKGGAKGKSTQPVSPTTIDEVRRRHVASRVKIRDGDGVREISTYEALLRQIEKLAFSGGVQATRLAIGIHEQTARELEAEHQDCLAWVTEYRANYVARAAAYERAGEAIPDWIAWPEDVHYSIEKGHRITGPYDAAGLENCLLLKRWRDAMFVKMIYDEAIFFWRPGVRTSLTTAEFIVFKIDTLMPKRWKLASQEMREREAALIWSSRPRLIEQLQEAFEALGIAAPLNHPMPPVPDKLFRALGINPKQLRAKFSAMEARQ